MENTVDKTAVRREARKDYVLASVYCIVMVVIQQVVAALLQTGFNSAGIIDKPYAQYLLILFSLHLTTAPICIFAFRKKKQDVHIEKKSISFLTFIGIIPIIYTMVIAGNMISSVISGLISDQSQQLVANLTTGDSTFFRILVVGISAPIIEEFLFRKTIIDRIGKHNEILAVVFSAVAFGFFHMNIAQFFYATFIGLVLGVVYVKTGKIIYTIILHMVVNLATSVIAANLMKLGETPLVIYTAVLMLLAALGIVLFAVKYRKFLTFKKNQDLTAGEAAKLMLVNPATIIYIVISIGFIALVTLMLIA